MKDEDEENINPEEENQELESQETEGFEDIVSTGNHFYENNENPEDTITKVTGMYKDWFLDYASYVILERAVPAIEDGFKPVQRRIMHSMKELDDGRYNKVANIVGHTMQYHPHGDASIGDAMVQ
ncbi:MAG: topoisomerase-4 subunit A, partial [Flavobacterium sp.]